MKAIDGMSWNDLIGSRLGQYEITDELGHGGSSRVYRAYDPERRGDVAIKVMPNDAEDRQGFLRRFDREVRIVKQLHHPNIVEIYGSGKTDELVYLVMRCVLGGTLRQRFGPELKLPTAISYIRQMAFALHHAHEKGIIHRDVKPSNMLVDTDRPGHVLLTDFGIAKIHGQLKLTKSGTTIGTPEYMSPEQAEGREIDRRADIYSLGCVLYEALAWRPPFVGASPVSVLYQQVNSPPPYIRGFNPDVPLELARVLARALAKEPADRYETAEIFAYALEPYVTESPRIASNRMTEVTLGAADVLSEQGFLPGVDAFAELESTDALNAARLFVPGAPPSDTDFSLPRVTSDVRGAPRSPEAPAPVAPAAPDEVGTLPGRPPLRPDAPGQSMRVPAGPSRPMMPGGSAPAAGQWGGPSDISQLPTAVPARGTRGRAHPVYGPVPSGVDAGRGPATAEDTPPGIAPQWRRWDPDD